MSKKDFTKYFRSGNRARGAVCSLQFGALEGVDTKVAIVVPSKVVAKASERNRIRRVLFSAFEEIIPEVTHPSFLIIILHKKPGDDLGQCKEEITAMLKKSAII